MQEFLAAEYFAYNIVQAVNKIQWALLKIQNARRLSENSDRSEGEAGWPDFSII